MSTLKTFSPEQVGVSFGGAPITGYGEGTFITAKRNSPNTNPTVGAGGTVGITKSADKTGTIELTLMQNAESNLMLADIQAQQDSADSDVLRGNLTITDSSGSYLCFAKNAHIMEPPDVTLAADQNEKTWTFFVEELTFTSSRGGYNPTDSQSVRLEGSVDLVVDGSAKISAEVTI